MRTFTIILCAIVIIITGLPLINTGKWWIRIFGFPILISLNYELSTENTDGMKDTNSNKEAEVEEIIEDEKKENVSYKVKKSLGHA